MNRSLLGFLILIVGLLIAILNKLLAKTAIEIRESIRRPVPSLKWTRVIIVVGGLVYTLIGLLVLLNVVQ
jgi:hypothetical protein